MSHKSLENVNNQNNNNPQKSFIFAKLPNWLMKRLDVSCGAKVVYAALDQYSHLYKEQYPSRLKLAEDCGMTVKVLDRYLNELKFQNLIQIIRRGKKQSNLYKILDHVWMHNAKTYTPKKPPIITQTNPHSELPNMGTPYKEKKIVSLFNKTNIYKYPCARVEPPTSHAELIQEFEKWWDAYPFKRSKTDSFYAFRLARQQIDFEPLLQKTIAYGRKVAGEKTPEKFIIHTKNWLKDLRWLDDYGKYEKEPPPLCTWRPTEFKSQEYKPSTPEEKEFISKLCEDYFRECGRPQKRGAQVFQSRAA